MPDKMFLFPTGQLNARTGQIKKHIISDVFFIYLAGLKGLEPSTFCVTGRRSNQLSYNPRARHILYCSDSKRKSFFYKIKILFGWLNLM